MTNSIKYLLYNSEKYEQTVQGDGTSLCLLSQRSHHYISDAIDFTWIFQSYCDTYICLFKSLPLYTPPYMFPYLNNYI